MNRLGELAHPPHGEQHAGHERAPVDRVVADRKRLALAAEDDLLVGDEARAGEPSGSARGRAAGLGDQLGGALRGPGRRVDACGRGEARRSRPPACAGPPRRRSASSAPRRSRSSGRRTRSRCPASATAAQLVEVEAGRPDHGVDAGVDAGADVVDAVAGVVKSTTTSAPSRTSASDVSSAGSARPASSMSSAPSTASQTVAPIRPGRTGDGDPLQSTPRATSRLA